MGGAGCCSGSPANRDHSRSLDQPCIFLLLRDHLYNYLYIEAEAGLEQLAWPPKYCLKFLKSSYKSYRKPTLYQLSVDFQFSLNIYIFQFHHYLYMFLPALKFLGSPLYSSLCREVSLVCVLCGMCAKHFAKSPNVLLLKIFFFFKKTTELLVLRSSENGIMAPKQHFQATVR